MADFLNVPAAVARAQIEVVLRAWGMPEDKIGITAEIMTETDLRGVDSHGISMLLLYRQIHETGQLKLAAEPRIVRQTPATALIDGGAGLGHPVSTMAMELAIDKAKATGIAAVSVFNSHHFGAAGIYSHMAAKANLIGMAVSTTRFVTVVPTRAAEAVLGTNVISLAAPSRDALPVILDIATSVVASNKVKIYALADKSLPAGWVVDARGEAVCESGLAFQRLSGNGEGGLTPIGGAGTTLGGHKGYGLGLFAQILAGSLSGGSFSPTRNKTQRPGDPDNIGHFFMAIDPQAFRPLDEFQHDVEDVVATLRSTRPIKPDEPVLIPGDPEWLTREQRLAEGIPMPAGLVEKIREIALAAGAPFLLGA
ncbi:malate dehydrogenase [Labrys miyagiensis]|uniref:Malate dehydrogenase n=1 Tax=Labrys miyagiensis TaxID=346912 RepID=A0ABQ6CEU5_9HYPH|nr:Ldh family oxidoreductase [Labrys miyagiensis]GLS18903.1 malate dehydrogenase [Labrys miyagiensis]